MWCRSRIAGLLMAILVGAATMAYGQTQVIPSITVSERYDSNVFFGLTGPGVKPDDYVTNVSPRLDVTHESRLVKGSVQGGLAAETYVNNPGLNYVAASGGATLILDQAVEQIIRGARLQLSDAFMYTPQPPAFLTPDASASASEALAFVRGIQAVRANMFTNTGSATASYLFSQNVKAQATYTHSLVKFGNSFADPGAGGALIPETTTQTVNAGFDFQVSSLDTLSPYYIHQKADYGGVGPGAFSFQVDSVNISWARSLTPTLQTKLGSGIGLIQPGQQVQYLANGMLQWTFPTGSATLSYSRAIMPSFFISTGSLLSQIFALTISHNLTERLAVTGNANYALNESTTGPPLDFESYFGALGMNYRITRLVTANVSYSYGNYKSSFVGTEFDLERHLAMVAIRAEWK